MPKHLIITLDGPAGAGKSTIAKSLSKRLGITYLDTGAMYRALTLKALRLGINLADDKALVDVAKNSIIDFIEVPEGSLHVRVDGEDVAQAIRTIEVTNNTFYAARNPGVRELMVNWQRAIGQARSIVTDGRDQGTVVFPKANFKFYLDADFEERFRRRLKELQDAGKAIDPMQLKNDMKDRDQKDFTRSVGPLKKADDAILINSTNLDVAQVVEKIMEKIKI